LSKCKFFIDSANVHWRDPKYAQDKSNSIDAVQEFLRNHSNIQNIALIQCTSPFISHHYLQEAFRKFSFHRDCVFSAVRSYKLRWKRDDNEKLVPINFDYRQRPRRQDWNGELIEAGMFYFATSSLLNQGLFQNDKLIIKFCFISKLTFLLSVAT
jgi:N-acylneuraminate/3-deoxy-D-glycero-D-galacto-nononate cytidylyltransferase